MSTDDHIAELESQFGDERAGAAAAIAAAFELIREKGEAALEQEFEAVASVAKPLFDHFAALLQQSVDAPGQEERALIDAITAALAIDLGAKLGAVAVTIKGPQGVPQGLQMLLNQVMENVGEVFGE